MRIITHAAVAALVVMGLVGGAQAADPYGTWTRPSTGGQVSFYDCGGKLCGKVLSVKDKKTSDRVGKIVIPGATKTGDNVWKGDFVNLEDGKTYSNVSYTLNGSSAMTLRGCALGGLVCKSETWTK